MPNSTDRHIGWQLRLAVFFMAFFVFETLTGLSIWLLPFSISNQWMVILHTLLGLLFLVPCTWYVTRHWLHYRPKTLSHIKFMGYGGTISLVGLTISGLILTYQAIFSIKISYLWDTIHIIFTFAAIVLILFHFGLILLRDRKDRESEEGRAVSKAQKSYAWKSGLTLVGFLILIPLLHLLFPSVKPQSKFPADYSYPFGEDRPFAPSLSRTDTGKAIDWRLFAGSESCGTSGCHTEIVEEWRPSAHRYAAMDAGFQAIQLNMANQNGPESTRYCGGCHDPISLFSGTKNIFTDTKQLTVLAGYQEGVSCLVCHAIKETDVKGNAAYIITTPKRYLFEMEYDRNKSEMSRFVRDFLIRAYPRHHVESLSKHLFKAPEFCAACHKQFIDREINKVGWVQLQNQYDNWRKSRWKHPDDPQKTIECRECHMYLVPSKDPASGDSADYNRSLKDGRHRNHRFVAANQFMPAVLKLRGWEKQLALTEKWLQGKIEISEIEDKWVKGPAVTLEISGPKKVHPGEEIEIRTVITSNKVGHDFPTGPLDIIQSWVELIVRDESGNIVFTSGTVNKEGFIQPGSFIFKAEPVDQNGNLIDRHNLWEMVGVRHRRALFPGFSDNAEFSFICPEMNPARKAVDIGEKREKTFVLQVSSHTPKKLSVHARICYRKIDQYLLNFIFGKESGLTSPITEMTSATHEIEVIQNE